MCDCGNLKFLKKHRFSFPEIKEYDNSIGELIYEHERLCILFEKILRHKIPAEFEINLCTSCGIIFSNPRFTTEEIKTKYKVASELEADKKRHGQIMSLVRYRKHAKYIHLLITRLYGNITKSLEVLDYGGAEGYNLSPFAETDNTCYLLDYIKYNRVKGVKYAGKDMQDLPSDKIFDIILLCNILEHAIEPQQLLKSLSSHLSESGLLYVEVPFGCWTEWKGIKEPLTHINFFSEESLFKSFRNAGLNVIYLSTAFQQKHQGKTWCLNIVGSKRKGHALTKFKTTRQQMENPYYYLKPFMNNPRDYLIRAAKKILRILRKK